MGQQPTKLRRTTQTSIRRNRIPRTNGRRSNSESPGDAGGVQPQGTLAGKGVMGDKHKGGSVTVKVEEPSYNIGLISLTTRID